MKRRILTGAMLLGVVFAGGCMQEEHQMAPGSELEQHRDGIDFKEDIQGDTATYFCCEIREVIKV